MRVKGKVYKMDVRPAMMYSLEVVAPTQRQEAGLKILRFSVGVTRNDKIRNEHTRGTAQVERIRDKVREAGLRWFGHAQLRDDGNIGQRVFKMELPNRRKRGKPQRRFMEVVKEDMQSIGWTEYAWDRVKWKQMSNSGNF